MAEERRPFGEHGADEGLGAANLNTLGTAPAEGDAADPRLAAGGGGGGPDPDGPSGPPDPTSRDAQLERQLGAEDPPAADVGGPGGAVGDSAANLAPADGGGGAGAAHDDPAARRSRGAAPQGEGRPEGHAADVPITGWERERDQPGDGDIPPPG